MDTLSEIATLLWKPVVGASLRNLGQSLFASGEAISMAALIDRLKTLPLYVPKSSVGPVSGTAPLTVTLSHSAGPVVLFSNWNIGTTTGHYVGETRDDGQYTFQNPGDFMVSLRITVLAAGAPQEFRFDHQVTVAAKAAPPPPAPTPTPTPTPSGTAELHLAIANPFMALQAGSAVLNAAQWTVTLAVGGGAPLHASGVTATVSLPSAFASGGGTVVVDVIATGTASGMIEGINYNGKIQTFLPAGPPTIVLKGAQSSVFFHADNLAISDQAAGQGVLLIPLTFSGVS